MLSIQHFWRIILKCWKYVDRSFHLFPQSNQEFSSPASNSEYILKDCANAILRLCSIRDVKNA